MRAKGMALDGVRFEELAADLIVRGPDGTWVDLAEGFRLQTPRQTVVEGRVRDGHFVLWTVTPERRREDVIIAGAK